VRRDVEMGLAESLSGIAGKSAREMGVRVGGFPSTPAERLKRPLWGASFRWRF